MPPPTFDQQAGTNSNSVAFTNNPPAKAAVVAFAYHQADANVSASGCGATWVKVATDGASQVSVFLGWNCSGALKTVTITCSGTVYMLKIVSFAGVISDSNPLDAHTEVTGTTHASLTNIFLNTGEIAFALLSDSDQNAYMSGGINTYPLTAQFSSPNRIISGYTFTNSLSQTKEAYTSESATWLAALSFKGEGAAAVSASATITGSGDTTGDLGNVVLADNRLPLELRVCSKSNPMGAPITIWPGQQGFTWYDPWNEMGSASLNLALADPKATATNLARYNLVRVYIGPFDVFDFWITTPAWNIASPAGSAGNLITVAGRGLEYYLKRARVWLSGASYAAQSAGAIMYDLIATAKARGALSLLTVDFNASQDSAGVAWPTELSSLTMDFSEGTDYLAVLATLRQAGVWARLRSDFVLQMWATDPGRDLSASVILRQGKHIAGAIGWQEQDADAASAMMARGNPGVAAVVIDGSTPLPDRFEGYVQGPETGDTATLIQIAAAEIYDRLRQQNAITVPVHHGLGAGEFETYRHYAVGDYVALHAPGYFDLVKKQIAAIRGSSDPGGGWAAEVELSAPRPNITVEITKRLFGLLQPRA